MNKYKDAVFIIGPGALSKPLSYDKEEFNEKYSRKKLIRDPEVFWDFVASNMLQPFSHEDQETYRMLSKVKEVTQLIVNQNSVGFLQDDAVNLHGLTTLFMCPKCKTFYPLEYVTHEPFDAESTKAQLQTVCELCDATIRPTALLSGERYAKTDYDRTIAALQNTHTVVLLGMDYSEESLMEQVSQFGDVKTFINSSAGEEEKMLVVIQSKEEPFDPNEMAFCEFLVRDNVKSALGRMTSAF